MSLISWRTAFSAATVVTALAGAFEKRPVEVVSKSLLVPLLHTRAMPPTLRVALAGAWVGDVVLLPPAVEEDEAAARRRLRRGAAAFAVQQVGYLALLRRARVRPKAHVSVAVAGWLAALAILDGRARPGGLDPVISGYGALLGTMAATAMAAPDRDLARGGALFLASDSMIMLRQLFLRQPVSRGAAEAFVLASYALAQRHLVDGLGDSADRANAG